MGKLEGKVAVITGAAGGIGREAAILFSNEGAKVCVADMGVEAGEKTAAECKEAFFFKADVSDPKSVQAMYAETDKRYGRIDVLYNNAGIMPADDDSILVTEPDAWDRVQAVNAKGVYLCCKYGIPYLLQSGGGSVINVASFVALVGCSVPQDAYTASKGAVLALSKSLAVQFGPKGVRTNAICPGPIETPLLTAWLFKEPAEKAKRMNRIPMGRFGKPEDIAYCAVYLASDESSWVTGTAFPVDGGYSAV